MDDVSTTVKVNVCTQQLITRKVLRKSTQVPISLGKFLNSFFFALSSYKLGTVIQLIWTIAANISDKI